MLGQGSMLDDVKRVLGHSSIALKSGTYAGHMTDTAAIRDFPCSICGEPVGYRELYPPGVPRAAGRGGEDPGRRLDRHWHYVSDGDRYGDSELTTTEFAQEITDLAGEHPESFLKLHCPKCQLVYCFAHWTVEYSDEPPVSFGICPQGHGRVIDMG